MESFLKSAVLNYLLEKSAPVHKGELLEKVGKEAASKYGLSPVTVDGYLSQVLKSLLEEGRIFRVKLGVYSLYRYDLQVPHPKVRDLLIRIDVEGPQRALRICSEFQRTFIRERTAEIVRSESFSSFVKTLAFVSLASRLEAFKGDVLSKEVEDLKFGLYDAQIRSILLRIDEKSWKCLREALEIAGMKGEAVSIEEMRLKYRALLGEIEPMDSYTRILKSVLDRSLVEKILFAWKALKSKQPRLFLVVDDTTSELASRLKVGAFAPESFCPSNLSPRKPSPDSMSIVRERLGKLGIRAQLLEALALCLDFCKEGVCVLFSEDVTTTYNARFSLRATFIPTIPPDIALWAFVKGDLSEDEAWNAFSVIGERPFPVIEKLKDDLLLLSYMAPS